MILNPGYDGTEPVEGVSSSHEDLTESDWESDDGASSDFQHEIESDDDLDNNSSNSDSDSDDSGPNSASDSCEG